MQTQQLKPRLLIEYRSLNYNKGIIKEQIESGVNPTLSGVFQSANEKNMNGRIYPKPILEREISKFSEIINENRAYGSLDHPESSIIELGNACVLIKEVNWDGMNVVGKLEVLNTSKGKDLKAILESGGNVGVSSRAFGSTQRTNEGNELVNDDLQLITFDIVSSPSVAKAILTENYDMTKKYFYNPKIDKNIVIENILDTIIKNY